MWAIATDVACRLSLSRTTSSCAKTDEPIEMLFGVYSRVDQSNHGVYHVVNWRHLANTVEQSLREGDVNCWYHYGSNLCK